MTGPTRRQGPHHSAQKSTRVRPLAVASPKLSSVITSALLSAMFPSTVPIYRLRPAGRVPSLSAGRAIPEVQCRRILPAAQERHLQAERLAASFHGGAHEGTGIGAAPVPLPGVAHLLPHGQVRTRGARVSAETDRNAMFHVRFPREAAAPEQVIGAGAVDHAATVPVDE